MNELVTTLSKVKNYNSQSKHYDAPYLTAEDMKNIECALEKTIPKCVIDKMPLEQPRKHNWYNCPYCHGDLTRLRPFYCPYCGQKLSWE